MDMGEVLVVYWCHLVQSSSDDDEGLLVYNCLHFKWQFLEEFTFLISDVPWPRFRVNMAYCYMNIVLSSFFLTFSPSSHR